MPNKLPVTQPFDLDLILDFDQGHRWRPDTYQPGWYTGVLGTDYVRIRQSIKHGPLEYDSSNTDVAHKLIWQFRLDGNDEHVEAVYAMMSRDPKMAALVERYRGLRLMRVDPWECLVFFILSAHNHNQSRVATSPTANSMDEIARRFWADRPWPHDRYPFPSPESLATEKGLRILQELWQGSSDGERRIRGRREMPQRIHNAAIFAKAGQLENLIGGRSSEHAVKVLRSMLPGVGLKTAQCVALFGLGYLDAFPLDTHVTNALLMQYGRDPFQPFAGYASLFLFEEGLHNQHS